MKDPVFKKSDFTICDVPVPKDYPQSQTHAGICLYKGKWYLTTSPFPTKHYSKYVNYLRAVLHKFSGGRLINPKRADRYENPCLYIGSKNQIIPTSFILLQPAPLLDTPIQPEGGHAYNSDPDIFIEDDTIYVLNRIMTSTSNGQGKKHCKSSLYLISGTISKDDISKLIIKEFGEWNSSTVVSHSLTKYKGHYYLIYLDTISAIDGKTFGGMFVKSADSIEGLIKAKERQIIVSSGNFLPWHMSLFQYKGKLYTIVATVEKGVSNGMIWQMLGEFNEDISAMILYNRPLTDFRSYRGSATVTPEGDFVLYTPTWNEKIKGSKSVDGKDVLMAKMPMNSLLSKVNGLKKVAIVFDGNIDKPKGKVNAVINRIRELKKIADYQLDVFCVQEYDTSSMRFISHAEKREKVNAMTIDGVEINIIWHKRYLVDWLLSLKCHRKPFRSLSDAEGIAHRFKNYDLICSHSFFCGFIAYSCHAKYNVPYLTNWHGVEIHTQPFRNPYQRKITTDILSHAEINLFVSKALSDSAKQFLPEFKYDVLYNGVDELRFYPYGQDEKNRLKESMDIVDSKVVAFVGNLYSIKNPMVLPEIFSCVKKNYNGNIKFWLIGDGDFREKVKERIIELNLESITIFWGNQPQCKMPDFMNCIDVLVLPSKNESFGMVLVEAIACGANAVGSKVGGISEVIGEENTFSLDPSFITNISDRICDMLFNNVRQSLKSLFKWNETAKRENEIIRNVLRYDNKRS